MAATPKKRSSTTKTSTRSRTKAATSTRARTTAKQAAQAPAPETDQAPIPATDAESPPATTETAPPIRIVSEDPAPETESSDPGQKVLGKVDLVDAVVARSEVKKRYAKPAVEAALALIGESLARGEKLNLPGLGKLHVQRATEKPNGTVIVARIRQPKKG